MNAPHIQVWKKVPGYDGYEVSNDEKYKGRFGGIKDSKDIKVKDGRIVSIGAMTNDGKYGHVSFSRLVAVAFHPNPDNLPLVIHKDGNIYNNKPENLEWAKKGDESRNKNVKKKKPYSKPLLRLRKDTDDVLERYNGYVEAVKWIRENADWDKNISKVEDLYSKIINAKS